MCHACQLGLFAHVPTFQKRAKFSFSRANVLINVPIFTLGVPTCQGGVKFSCVNFSTSSAKRRTNFSTIFQRNFWIFQLYLTFATNFKNIWAILENLSRETKNLHFDICQISSRKNFQPKTFDAVFNEHAD